jgi:hypothetical protein
MSGAMPGWPAWPPAATVLCCVHCIRSHPSLLCCTPLTSPHRLSCSWPRARLWLLCRVHPCRRQWLLTVDRATATSKTLLPLIAWVLQGLYHLVGQESTRVGMGPCSC